MRPVRRTARQWLLLLHVVCSLGWMGAGAANLVLEVVAWRDYVLIRGDTASGLSM